MLQTILFDLDGTLAESKKAVTPEMAALLTKLTCVTTVAVISGGALEQFLKQIVAQLPSEARLSQLYLLPTSGAALYRYQEGQWVAVYEERLTPEEATLIAQTIRAAAEQTHTIDFSQPSFGERIEYRGSQVTLSALGQQAPIEEKVRWDPDHTKRRKLQEVLVAQLPNFSIKIGGTTSVDVTKRNIDKAYGVRKLSEIIGVPISRMLYIGDALFPGGNDEIVKETGIETIQVNSPAETAARITHILTAA